ncbi:hypothetical protein LSAT2_017377 [Lamellibrachia satsuma]|nr:hypothetical protein LSAT2_017377 [Lamellibrachia satsuma]
MSTRFFRRTVRSQGQDPLDLLERMLNRTTLSTKRIVHGHIIELGESALKKTDIVIDDGRDQAVREALAVAERRHTRELKAALQRLEREMMREKNVALARQKQYFEDLSERVATQRDRVEQERTRDLKRRLGKEKEEALKQQWTQCEQIKHLAIKEACDSLQKTIQEELAVEKERSLAEALATAEEGFKMREEEAIRTTREACEKVAKEAAETVAKTHTLEIHKHEQRHTQLLKRLTSEAEIRHKIEQDFQDLQDDYRRFLDYTDGFHSDYLLRMRPFYVCRPQETMHRPATAGTQDV